MLSCRKAPNSTLSFARAPSAWRFRTNWFRPDRSSVGTWTVQRLRCWKFSAIGQRIDTPIRLRRMLPCRLGAVGRRHSNRCCSPSIEDADARLFAAAAAVEPFRRRVCSVRFACLTETLVLGVYVSKSRTTMHSSLIVNLLRTTNPACAF